MVKTMTNNEIESVLTVRDIMTSPVVTVREDDSVQSASILMKDHEIGGIVIVDGTGRPIGMLTERDIVIRVAANNQLPGTVSVEKVMSRPLITVSPEVSLAEAAKKMSGGSIRRLAVLERGRLVGIVSSKDIVSIMPELTEIIAHKVRLTPDPEEERPPMTGYCDNCNQWSENMIEVEGDFLCEECRAELMTEM